MSWSRTASACGAPCCDREASRGSAASQSVAPCLLMSNATSSAALLFRAHAFCPLLTAEMTNQCTVTVDNHVPRAPDPLNIVSHAESQHDTCLARYCRPPFRHESSLFTTLEGTITVLTSQLENPVALVQLGPVRALREHIEPKDGQL